MNENLRISTLLLDKEIFQIFQEVLNDHGLDEFRPGEETLSEFLGADKGSEFSAIRMDFKTKN